MSARILVVDDDEDLREILCEALAFEGYEAVEAGDGEQALATLEHQSIDAVLLDLMMPNMNGWQVRAEMKRNPELAAIPVVVMTAARPAHIDELEAAAYLQKPVGLKMLLATLQGVLAA